MNSETLKGDWNMLKGKIKEKWGKLTDDDLTAIGGKRDQLLGAIQKKYGIAKERAEHDISEWEKSYDQNKSKSKEGGMSDHSKHSERY